MNAKKTALMLSSAAGLAIAATATAQAPFVVNLSGATLLQNQLVAPALTNDFIDVNGNGVAGQNPPPQLNRIEQLAPTYSNPFLSAPPPRTTTVTSGNGNWWIVTYRATGSVNGFREMAQFSAPGPFAGVGQNGSGYDPDGVLFSRSTRSIANRTQFIDSNIAGLCSNPAFNGQNPGASPVRSATTLTSVTLPNSLVTSGLEATWASPSGCNAGTNPFPANGLGPNVPGGGQGLAAAGGTRIDIAPVDVPSTWAVQGPSGPLAASALPTTTGYGRNPRLSIGLDGTSTGLGAGIENVLADLGNRNLAASGGTPDENTIFDTEIAFATIAPIVNLGVSGIAYPISGGYERRPEISQTDLRFFFATGRMPNGENLVAVTRDAGSGTRNGFYNTMGLDPSFGVGDNVGGSPISGSNNPLEDQLGSTFVPGNKAGNSNLERAVINHRLAIGYAGAERAVTGSAPGSWGTAGRLEILSVKADLTVGPNANFVRPTITNVLRASPTNPNSYVLGGPAVFAHVGDPRNQNEIGGTPGNSNPRMANPQAAAFLNNISRSIESFIAIPTGPSSEFTPGELFANELILKAALDAPHSAVNPLQLVPQTPNTSLQNDTLVRNRLANPFFAAPFGSVTLNGVVPIRRTGTYTDGNTGAHYVLQNGSTIAYGNPLDTRNRVSGDFNGDGRRDLNDAVEMMRAFHSRNGGPVWVAPNYTGPNATGNTAGGFASIEILGDFNGDGNFNAADIRYWADGLAIDPATGRVDRKAGFEAVDNAWQSITGNSNFFGTVLTGPSGNVPYVVGASRFDIVGSGGIARGWAPVGANGTVNADDRAYIAAQIAATGGNGAWSAANINNAVNFDLSADVTGDLVVDQADLDAFDAIFGACYANCDGSTGTPALTPADFVCFLNKFRAGDPYANCDGSTGTPALTPADFVCFLNKFRAGC